MKHPFARMLCAGLAALVTLVASAQAPKDPIKIAFVYVGPVGDGGWTYHCFSNAGQLSTRLMDL